MSSYHCPTGRTFGEKFVDPKIERAVLDFIDDCNVFTQDTMKELDKHLAAIKTDLVEDKVVCEPDQELLDAYNSPTETNWMMTVEPPAEAFERETLVVRKRRQGEILNRVDRR